METLTKIITGILICFTTSAFSQALIIDHNCAKLEPIPASAIEQAKADLHIAYMHTSHGSQLITGMTGLIGQSNLIGYKGDIYQWNEGGNSGALDIDDNFIGGDLGHNGDTSWAAPTRNYLAQNPDVNVVIYSWCGGCSDNTIAGIQTYLDKMNQLEQEYPEVKFVYMTGHTDIWADATLKANNQQIRDYCTANNKILYDFADIESYNPDGEYYEFVNDNCNYYSGAGTGLLGNWAEEWQNSHTEGIYWYSCSAAHSKPLNGNLKAYAAWWLWCRLAGWNNSESPVITSTHDDQTLEADANCQADLPDYTGDVVAYDDNDPDLEISQSPAAGTVITDETTVTLTVEDDDGNTASVSFNVTLADMTAPIVTCPETQTVNADETHTYTVQGTEFDPTEIADNCSVASVLNDFNNTETLENAQLPEGTTSIIWTVTDLAGNTDSCSIDIVVNEYIVGIKDIEPKVLTLYPNPTNGKLTLNIENKEVHTFTITDIAGKEICKIKNVQKSKEIDLSQFQNGVYFIYAISGNKTFVAKILKN